MGIFGPKEGDGSEQKEAKEKFTRDLAEASKEDKNSKTQNVHTNVMKDFKSKAYEALMERVDLIAANKMEPDRLREEVEQFISEFSSEMKVQINSKEQRQVATSIVDDMIGLGPLEELIHDDSISDILVNNAKDVYVERKGHLERVRVKFYDEAHLEQIARRIAGRVGRRIDQASPMVDARLADGSRVNIIMPPLALDGTAISIRKFSKADITLEKMVDLGTISENMATFLKIVSSCRLNILISGGTGSGKTTLLNAMSHVIDPNERIVSIEDSAELRLQQPHVVRLESRPPNIEGEGEITIRELVRNALRMRPDRIIVGEVRGDETIDMLQAMNTGHDGSMSTIHANRPREALTRLENMLSMSGYDIPTRVLRSQIVGAVNLIVHTERMRDGVRRVTEIMELSGVEGDVITGHVLFKFVYQEDVVAGEAGKSTIRGTFEPSGVRPNFSERVRFFGKEKELLAVLRGK